MGVIIAGCVATYLVMVAIVCLDQYAIATVNLNAVNHSIQWSEFASSAAYPDHDKVITD